MAAENCSHGEGPFSAEGDDNHSQQPLVVIKPRGRPSNWAKKFAFQQMKDSQQKAQPQSKKSPAPETVTQRKGTRTRARKPKNEICSPDPVDAAPTAVAPQVLVTPGPSESPSPSPAPQPSVDVEDSLPVVRDDDSLFEGDAGSLFGGDNGPDAFARAPSHANSLFVGGDDEPTQTQASSSAVPVQDRRSPFRDVIEAAVHQPLAPNDEDGTQGSLFGRDGQAAQCLPAFSNARRRARESVSPSHGDDEPAKSQSAPSTGKEAIRSSPCHGSIPTCLFQSSPSAASERTHIECELATMADEVRRWEAVTQQVATSTAEMSALIRDLAAQSFASRPPSASVRAMLSPADQARFRDQLLRATQLSLKADLVQTLAERDSETRRAQVRCVAVLAVAVVLAAFMVSPFAGRVAEWLEWAVRSS